MDAARERFLTRAGRILPELTAAVPRLRTLDSAHNVLEKRALSVMKICADAVKSSHGNISVDVGGMQGTLHRLQGESFWTAGVSKALLNARILEREVANFLEYLAGSSATTKEVERRLVGFFDIEHRWSLIASAMQAAETALHPAHLEKALKAVDSIVRHTPDLLGYAGSDEWQLAVRVRGTVLEVRQWVDSAYSTSEQWKLEVNIG